MVELPASTQEGFPVTSREWRWATGWSVVILLLSCVPYAIATLLAPEGWQFAGILANPFDSHSYLAKMRQGFEGNWLFHLTYTPEPHEGAFIFTFYLALGHLAALTHLPLVWVFHLARLATGFGLLLTTFRFIAHITPRQQERRLAFVLLFSASGLGWLGAIFGAFPIDLWIPEAFVPYSLFANPHFPLGMALMVVLFQLVIWPSRGRGPVSGSRPTGDSKSVTQNQNSNLHNLKLGLAALALALTLPFALLMVWAILVVYFCWFYLARGRLPWPQIWPTLGLGLFSAPVIIYDYWVSTTNPVIAGWSAQNVTPAPAISDLVLGYGVVGLLAIVGAWSIVRQRGQTPEPGGEWLVLLWASTTVVLVYLPFDLQRRLINGLHIPVSILAAIGLTRGLAHSPLKSTHRRLLTNAVVAVGAVGTLFVWVIPLLATLQSPSTSETTALLFLRQEETAALDWLGKNSTMNDVVLASPRLAMFVPGQTGARTFYGHPFETLEADTRKAMAEAFYRAEIDTITPRPDFIIYGPSEQALGRPKNLADYPIVFAVDGVLIYKVTK